MELIVITTALALNLQTAIKIAADRGAFKLEEFGSVATVAEELAKSIKENRVPATQPPEVAVAATENTI